MFTYDECQEIIRAFRQTHPNVLMSPQVHGIQVISKNNQPILELLVTQKVDAANLSADEIMPKAFTCKVGGQDQTFQTSVIQTDIPRPCVDQGGFASNVAPAPHCPPYGTAGWNVHLISQNIWVCMSNHHVMVDFHNPTFGANIFLGDTCTRMAHQAQLHAFALTESWDYALASYNNPNDASQQFVACSPTHTYPDARRLAEDISIGSQYHKVGARTGCTTGRLRGVGDRRVGPYPDGSTRLFRGQLIFENMSDGGDSGSIIIRDSDNAVTGLLFAGHAGDPDTLANPLYQIGWTYVGDYRLEGGGTVPIYDDTHSVIPTARGDDALSPPSDPIQITSAEIAATPDLSGNVGIQQIGGLFFLGIAVHSRGHMVPGGSRWGTPIPPPIRNVEVRTVLLRTETLQHWEGRTTVTSTFLCFG